MAIEPSPGRNCGRQETARSARGRFVGRGDRFARARHSFVRRTMRFRLCAAVKQTTRAESTPRHPNAAPGRIWGQTVVPQISVRRNRRLRLSRAVNATDGRQQKFRNPTEASRELSQRAQDGRFQGSGRRLRVSNSARHAIWGNNAAFPRKHCLTQAFLVGLRRAEQQHGCQAAATPR